MPKQQVATRFPLIKIVTSSNFWCLRMNRINYYPKKHAGRYNSKHFRKWGKCLGLLLPILPRQILPYQWTAMTWPCLGSQQYARRCVQISFRERVQDWLVYDDLTMSVQRQCCRIYFLRVVAGGRA